ncbi:MULTISPECIES: DUF3499 domain-containing protein [Kocuria]|uniref:DUF3499 domain-containing protein n=1 Tax=Kocuria TaxID=57493 RepID=UPI0021A6CEDA|nr:MULTISPECIES: DUF3499 domain-containing protein [Kocuria]MDN3462887.1 DUF3499 domain-containing protein [Kocuria sp. APC 4018]
MPDAAAPRRSCSKLTCNREAVCTLTYVYSDSTAVIGALSARREPHAYDLCPAHADALTAPRGWRIVRLEAPGGWSRDDLDNVVQAVSTDDTPPARRAPGRGPSLGAARPTGGARVLRDVSYRVPPAQDAPGRAPGAPDGTSGADRNGTEDAGGAPSAHGNRSREYPEPTQSVAKAHSHPAPPRSVAMPDELRTPHWRRP